MRRSQVINTVTKLLDKLEEEGLLLTAPDLPLDITEPIVPSDERSMIVKEMLDTERQYVSFLEVLQVSLFRFSFLFGLSDVSSRLLSVSPSLMRIIVGRVRR